MQDIAIFIFRRDLRLFDNVGLIQASRKHQYILPIFIFDNRQQESNNAYFSVNAFKFMLKSLWHLNSKIKEKNGSLQFFQGDPNDIITKLKEAHKNISSVYVNKDYTPFSIKRDEAIESLCKKLNLKFYSYHNNLLQPPGSIKTNNDDFYTVFTPFYKAALKAEVPKCQSLSSFNFLQATSDESILMKMMDKYTVESKLSSDFYTFNLPDNYKKNRDKLYITTGTSRLSAKIKFGVLSIREIYHQACNANMDFYISELYWRDFYAHIAYDNPHVFGSDFNKKYSAFPWKKNQEHLEKWQKGETGFPIVDAGMRELNTSGYMHNRARMITASFLCKILRIHWQEGEKYFASKLIDYDPCSNNGGWQWCASTGCDSQPYFRIFNPWLQMERFDPDRIYVKKWVPQLRNVSNSVLTQDKIEFANIANYPKPIVNYKTEREITLEKFKEIS